MANNESMAQSHGMDIDQTVEFGMINCNDNDFSSNLSNLISTTFKLDGSDEMSERKPKADKGV